ncbi:alanyl-tRNA synthetase [Streptomyces sp. 8N706]|uniref:alanyl-tRNA synthetase n=1 Tax=Streptomyces sp. 8N706 TaxID=3457416 RepID=UPI003FCF98B6
MAQQRQLYLDDTYAYDVETEVVSAGGHSGALRIALADNIFHPQGGGQPDDSGWVADVPVTPVRDGETGWVFLTPAPGAGDTEASFAEGTRVRARIDDEQRRLHAALHTAGHLVDALVRPRGLRHIGNNHFPGQARIEYELNGVEIDKDGLAESLTAELEKAIAEALPVTMGERDGRRTITIEGLATEFCGGTHVIHLGLLAEVTVRSIKAKSGRLKVGYAAQHTARF